MLKVIVLSRLNDKDFWQERFNESYSGPVDLRLQEEFPHGQTFDLIILDLSGTQSSAFSIQPKDVLSSLTPLLTNRKFFIATDKKDADLAIEAIKLGADGFLVKPFTKNELKISLDRLQESARQQAPVQQKKARVISLLSYKGGTGVSTACVNLAHTISTLYQKKTLVIDAAGFSNHSTVLLNVVPKCTLVDICKPDTQIDEYFLESAVRMVSPTLSIIGGPLRVEDVGLLNIKSIEAMMQIALNQYDYILIDTSTHLLDELTMFFIQKADDLLLLTTFDLLAVKDNRFYIQALKEFGIEENKIKPIINRQDWFVGSLEPELIQKQINHPIYYSLPNDWELCVEASNYGRPILEFAPTSQLAMAYRLLAGKLTGLDIGMQASTDKEEIDINQSDGKAGKKKKILNWF